VGFHVKERRLPPIESVTGSALAAVLPLRKLACVFVLVAVHTLRECKRLFEVAVCVAEQAIDGQMFAEQRILGLRVIKVRRQSRAGNPLPAARVVAGVAGFRCEAALVRIRVAI